MAVVLWVGSVDDWDYYLSLAIAITITISISISISIDKRIKVVANRAGEDGYVIGVSQQVVRFEVHAFVFDVISISISISNDISISISISNDIDISISNDIDISISNDIDISISNCLLYTSDAADE